MEVASLHRKVERWIRMRRFSCRIGGFAKEKGDAPSELDAEETSARGILDGQFTALAQAAIRVSCAIRTQGKEGGEHRTVDARRSPRSIAKERGDAVETQETTDTDGAARVSEAADGPRASRPDDEV
jgi:hypothetical protein